MDRESLRAAFSLIGRFHPSAQAAEPGLFVDVDGDGTLTVDELTLFLKGTHKHEVADMLAEVRIASFQPHAPFRAP